MVAASIRQARKETQAALQQREEAEQRHEEAQAQLVETTKTVIEPLRRSRQQMIRENHVREQVVRLITEGGGK